MVLSLGEAVETNGWREYNQLRILEHDQDDSKQRHYSAAEDDLPVEKGNDWSLQESVTLFMNAGKMLRIRPKDIAGLLYNEGGAPKDSIGDIRMFPKHTLIEVSPEVAPQLVERLATATVCGYEVNIREDQGRPAPRPSFRNNEDFRPRDRQRRDRDSRPFRASRDSRKRDPRFFDRFNRRPRCWGDWR